MSYVIRLLLFNVKTSSCDVILTKYLYQYVQKISALQYLGTITVWHQHTSFLFWCIIVTVWRQYIYVLFWGIILHTLAYHIIIIC